MAKMLVINPEKCTACRMCELACSLKHHDEYNPTKSRIRTLFFEEDAFYIPVTCLQCEDPWCGKVCPSEAITRDENTGIVSVSEMKCVGCEVCTLACPFGAMIFYSKDRCAEKCDLCGGEPECVKFCLREALEFREIDGSTISKMKTISKIILESSMISKMKTMSKIIDSYKEAKF